MLSVGEQLCMCDSGTDFHSLDLLQQGIPLKKCADKYDLRYVPLSFSLGLWHTSKIFFSFSV